MSLDKLRAPSSLLLPTLHLPSALTRTGRHQAHVPPSIALFDHVASAGCAKAVSHHHLLLPLLESTFRSLACLPQRLCVTYPTALARTFDHVPIHAAAAARRVCRIIWTPPFVPLLDRRSRSLACLPQRPRDWCHPVPHIQQTEGSAATFASGKNAAVSTLLPLPWAGGMWCANPPTCARATFH